MEGTECLSALRPGPVCGVLSVLLPLVGCGLCFTIIALGCRQGSVQNLLGAVGIWLASMPFGILVAVISWARRERWPLLRVVGGLLSLSPLVFGLALLMLR